MDWNRKIHFKTNLCLTKLHCISLFPESHCKCFADLMQNHSKFRKKRRYFWLWKHLSTCPDCGLTFFAIFSFLISGHDGRNGIQDKKQT